MNEMNSVQDIDSRDEVISLLSEYTDRLKLFLDHELHAETKEASQKRLLVVVFSTVMGILLPALVYFDQGSVSSNNVRLALATIAGFLVVSVGFAMSSLWSRSQTKSQKNDVRFSAKILERILARAVQISDHSKQPMDLSFEVRIAEAEAVLERFYSDIGRKD